MNNFIEENKTLLVVISIIVIFISIFILVKGIFFYSASDTNKNILRPPIEKAN